MAYKLAIFDLDGTILDTIEDLADSVNHVLTEAGMPLRSLEEVRAFTGNGAFNLIKCSLPEGCALETVNKTLDAYKLYYNAHSEIKTRPYDGIIGMLTELRAGGCKIAVLSNKPDTPVQTLCKKYFGDIFDYTAGEKDGIARKPAPDGVDLILSELGIRREDSVFIGDSEVDIDTAKNAGVHCISVPWGFRDESVLIEHGADFIAHSAAELAEMILK